MKEAIISILIEHDLDFDKTPFYHSAKEIAEMMTAFIEWIRTSDTLDNNINDWICGKITNDKLFTYWHTEIYKKQK
jgi:hypothetical protein